MNEKVTLRPKSKYGYRRLADVGTAIWVITEEKDGVSFSDKPGPWLYVRPDTSVDNRTNERWINELDDYDFYILRNQP